MAAAPSQDSIEAALAGPLWLDDLAFAALEFQQAGRLTAAQLRLVDRFLAFLQQRGKSLAEAVSQDFEVFGSQIQVENLARALSVLAPGAALHARPALKALRAARWRKEKKRRKPRKRPRRRLLSLPRAVWPAAWQHAVADLEARARARVEDEIPVHDKPVYAVSVVRSLAQTVGQLARSNRDQGLEGALTIEAVDIFLKGFRKRQCRANTKHARTKELIIFATELGAAPDVIRFLRQLKEGFKREARLSRTRKEDVLLHFQFTLGDIYLRAQELLERAGERPAHHDAAFHDRMDAALIGLSCNAPLRCGDLHRLRIGREIARDETGWTLRLDQQKNLRNYGLRIWPEVAEMLDALILNGRPPEQLPSRLEELSGCYLFSWDGGIAPVDDRWPTKVWRRHFGVGEHYVRSLWCSHYAEEDPDNAWAASALVGQGSERTRKVYEVNVQRQKSMSTVQSLIGAMVTT